MAQADLSCANASGQAFRQDVNNQLQALGTLQSGTTAPTTTYAYMLWADEANGVLKQRNSANNAWVTVATLGANQWGFGRITAGTVQATTSGTTKDITGIPSWAKRISVVLDQVSTNGTSIVEIRIGTSAGVEATGYSGSATAITGTNTCGVSALSTGFTILGNAVTSSRSGLLALVNITGNTWVASGAFSDNTPYGGTTHGSKTLAGVFDRIRLTTQNGTDAFDAGSVNVLYEG